MKQYKVAQGTVGRLISLTKQLEREYPLTEDKAFSEEDVVFSPMTMFQQFNQIVHEYGFKTGTPEQRARFVWVINSKFVTEEDDDRPDFE
jgi:hypothetical protein